MRSFHSKASQSLPPTGGKEIGQHRTNASAAGWRVVSPIRAVWKTGNTPRIPLFSKHSAEEKSLVTGSCRIVRCCHRGFLGLSLQRSGKINRIILYFPQTIPPRNLAARRGKTMKATGIVRRVDDLGRIVIPKEIRRTLRIREGDPLLTSLTVRQRFACAVGNLESRTISKE